MNQVGNKPKPTPLRFETYVRAAKNAPGTGLFRSLLMRDAEGREFDVLNDGEYSCAYFVSSLLSLAGFLPEPVTTVNSLEKRLAGAGWQKRSPKKGTEPGDVLIWEKEAFDDGTENRHAGIAISPTEAVSTSYLTKNVERHHRTFGTRPGGTPKRMIESVFRHPTPSISL